MEISQKIMLSVAGWVLGITYLIVLQQSFAERFKLVLIWGSAVCLRAAASLYPYLHSWDEQYHALVAKNLSENPLWPKLFPLALLEYDYKDWAANYTWLHKQPLSLWAISGSISVFGNHEIAVRLPSIVLSSLAVILTFYIGKRLFNSTVGYWAAFFHAVNGWVVEMTGGSTPTDHVDVFFAFFIELAVFFALLTPVGNGKKAGTAVLTGMAIGLAILSKWLPALIVLPIYLIVHWKTPRFGIHFLLVVLATALVALPWQFYAMRHFPLEYFYELDYNQRHITEVLEGHQHSAFYYLNNARVTWNELIYIPLIWLIARLLFSKYDMRWVVPGIWIFVPYLIFSFVATQMPGYVFFTGPAIFITLAAFLANLQTSAYKKYGFAVFFVLSVLLAMRYSIERLKPLASYAAVEQKKRTIKTVLSALPRKTVLYNTADDYVAVMFYCDIISFPRLPFPEHIPAIQQQGYDVILMDRGTYLPEVLSGAPGVKVLKLNLNPER